jgi:hypothetical protein
LGAVDAAHDDDFRSISELIGSLESDELRMMFEQLEDLQGHPGWQHLARLLRLERETQVRRMTSSAVLEHAQYAHKAGLVHGLAAPWAVVQKVASTHRRVQAELARVISRDGES